jgi:GntR family transcriptional regulator
MSSSDIVGYTEVYLWREFESHLDQILKRGEPIHKQIDSVLGIEAGDIVQNISAITMPAEAASVLGADLNSPALEIVRHYSGSNGRSFEVARSIHSAKDYRYSQVFRRYPNLPPS